MPTLTALSPARRTPRLSAGLARICTQVIGGSLLMAAAAHVAVPFWPVPLTLQTLAVLGLGAAFGPVTAAAVVLGWIAEGMLGLPVFAAGAGPAVLLGPTGGYIVGYLPAALIAGLAARSGWRRSLPRTVAAFAAAEAVLFAFGVAWLAHLVGAEKAVKVGLLPFILGEALKVGLLTAGVQLLAARRS